MSDTESAGRQRDKLDGDFAQAVAPLADGESRFPPPFDMSSSAALADNLDIGEIAERLWEVTAARDTGYSILITEQSMQHPDLHGREVLNTFAPSTNMLIAFLASLLDELIEQQQSRKDI